VCVCHGLYETLFFLVFLSAVKCAVAGSLIATCVWLASRVYVCMRPGKLVCGSNWSLCDLFVDVCIVVLLSIIFNFLNFVCSWDTRRWIKSKSTIRLILFFMICCFSEQIGNEGVIKQTFYFFRFFSISFIFSFCSSFILFLPARWCGQSLERVASNWM
jgi:hypothetical protein